MQDEEHLRLLSIFHYIMGGLCAFFACFPIIYVVFGIVIVSGGFPIADDGTKMPAAFGWLLIAFGGALFIVGWSYAISLVIVGRCLQRRRRHLFCLIMAGISCVNVPFGTCLGVFTILVLSRPSVKRLFDGQRDVVFVSEFL